MSSVAGSAPRFTIGEAIGEGWEAFKANFAPMALYAVLVWAVSALVNLVFGNPEGGVRSLIAFVISFVVNQIITIGWLRIALDAIDGRRASPERIRASMSVLVPFMVAALVFSFAVTIGLVLLIIPGIIVAIVLGFYGWILVDGKETDAMAALRRSAEITRGERLHLFGLGLMLLLLNIVGLMALIIGIIVTSAISILALGHVYRRLEQTAMGAAR